MTPVYRALLALLILLPGLATAAFAQSYTINPGRPYAVGDTYTVAIEMSAKERITMSYKKNRDSSVKNSTVRLNARVQVLAVDSNGRETKKNYTVASCTRTSEDGTTALVAEGKVIEVRFDEDGKHITLDGVEPDPSVEKQLADIVDNGGAFTAEKSSQFGLDKKRKPGESWKVDLSSLVGILAKSKMQVNPRDANATMTFTEITNVNGVQCAHLQIRAAIKKFSLPETGITVKKSSMTVTVDGYMPVNPQLHVPQRSQQLSVSMNGSNAKMGLIMVMNLSQKLDATYTY